jgi:hypothetical protein
VVDQITIGAGSIVTRDIPAGVIAYGNLSSSAAVDKKIIQNLGSYPNSVHFLEGDFDSPFRHKPSMIVPLVCRIFFGKIQGF